MKILSIDLSTKSGWAVFIDGKYVESGGVPKTDVKNFNVNNDPNKHPDYPNNLINAAEEVGRKIKDLLLDKKPDFVVIENTVRGKNRHTQRILEYMHFVFTKTINELSIPFKYLDPSEWRKAVSLILSKEDKKNNALVSKGKARGRVSKKHLAIRKCEELYGLKLKVKENDIADSILLGQAWLNLNHP